MYIFIIDYLLRKIDFLLLGDTKVKNHIDMASEYTMIASGRSYNPPNWYYNPANLVNRIYYICGGTAYYRGTTLLKPGFLYIFRASPYFQVSQSVDDPVDHVYFDFVTYRKFIKEEYIEIAIEKHPRLKALLEIIKEDFNNPPYPSPIAKSYMDILIHFLKDYLALDTMYSSVTSAVLKAIHRQDFNHMSVNNIADELNMNVNHIIRCFKKELGITPHKYISMLKTDLAIAYIRQGLNSIEIADRLGFNSVPALSYAFKRETGKNLSDYK